MKDQIGALMLAERLTNMARWQRENMGRNDAPNNFKNGNLVEEAAACLRRAAALLDTSTLTSHMSQPTEKIEPNAS